MSALVRCCVTRRRRSFSQRPLSQATSPSMLSRSPAHPLHRSLRLTCWTLTPRQDPAPERENHPSTAYLQYTSGSTRQPAGVMISHRNLFANFEQIMSDYFVEYGKVAPPDTTIVSWLPFYHDMGLISGNLRTDSGGTSRCAHESGVVPAAAGPVDAIAGKQ